MYFLSVSGLPITVNLPYLLGILRKKFGKAISGKFWVVTIERIPETETQVANIKFDNFDDVRKAQAILHCLSLTCKGEIGALRAKIEEGNSKDNLNNRLKVNKPFIKPGLKEKNRHQEKRQIYDELFNARQSVSNMLKDNEADQMKLDVYDNNYRYDVNRQNDQDSFDNYRQESNRSMELDFFGNYRNDGNRQLDPDSFDNYRNYSNRQKNSDPFHNLRHEDNRQINQDIFDNYREESNTLNTQGSSVNFRHEGSGQDMYDNYRHEENRQILKVPFNNFRQQSNMAMNQDTFDNYRPEGNRQMKEIPFDNFGNDANRQINRNTFDNYRNDNRQMNEIPFDNYQNDNNRQMNLDTIDNNYFKNGSNRQIDPDSFDNYRSKVIRQVDSTQNNRDLFERDLYKNKVSYSKSHVDSQEEAAKLELEIEILRKQRLIVEEERKLLLEKKKLDMLKESSPRHISPRHIAAPPPRHISARHLEGSSRRTPPRHASRPDVKPRREGVSKLNSLPQFKAPVKVLMKQLIGFVAKLELYDTEKSKLLTLVRDNIRKRIAVMLEKKDYYLNAAQVVDLYRKTHPASSDAKFVNLQHKVVKDLAAKHIATGSHSSDYVAFDERDAEEEIFQDKSASDYWNENV